MNFSKLFLILIESFFFIASFASIVAAFLMFSLKKKIGTGILAAGFKNIAFGTILLALGIIVDTITSYFILSYNSLLSSSIFLLKGLLFVVGAYTIVIACKKMIDNLESIVR